MMLHPTQQEMDPQAKLMRQMNSNQNSTTASNVYMSTTSSSSSRSHLSYVNNPNNGLNILNNKQQQQHATQQMATSNAHQFMKYQPTHQPFSTNNHHLNYAAANNGIFSYHQLNGQNSKQQQHVFRNGANNLNRLANSKNYASNKENNGGK